MNTTSSVHGQAVNGIGRLQLERRVTELTAERDSLTEEVTVLHRALRHIERERGEMFLNLTATQALCTQQLNELRVWRSGELEPLALAMSRARSLHPEGTAFRDIVAELGELAETGDIKDESERDTRVREEAIDVAVTAMRFALGDRRE
jgi:hypothetical protein